MANVECAPSAPLPRLRQGSSDAGQRTIVNRSALALVLSSRDQSVGFALAAGSGPVFFLRDASATDPREQEFIGLPLPLGENSSDRERLRQAADGTESDRRSIRLIVDRHGQPQSIAGRPESSPPNLRRGAVRARRRNGGQWRTHAGAAGTRPRPCSYCSAICSTSAVSTSTRPSSTASTTRTWHATKRPGITRWAWARDQQHFRDRHCDVVVMGVTAPQYGLG